MSKQRKKVKQVTRAHYALFCADLPFGHKVERDRTKYQRKQKHCKKDIE